MHLRRAQPFMEWNLNTIITVAGFVIMLLLYAGKSGQLVERLDNIAKNQEATSSAVAGLAARITAAESDIREEKSWRAAYEATNRDRRGEIDGSISALGAQSGALDQRIDSVEAVTTRQSEQQSATNARLGEALTAIRDLQKQVADVASDQKVILNRIGKP